MNFRTTFWQGKTQEGFGKERKRGGSEIIKGQRLKYLIMQPRLRQALLNRLVLIKNMPQILHRRRDDPAPARRPNNEIQRAVRGKLDNSRRDGRQRPLARLDEIGRRRRVAEGVGLAGDGEVVHLVVHDDAGFGDDELAAEEEVDGRGDGDGHAGGVGRDDVGGTMAGKCQVRRIRLGNFNRGWVWEYLKTYVCKDSNPVGS